MCARLVRTLAGLRLCSDGAHGCRWRKDCGSRSRRHSRGATPPLRRLTEPGRTCFAWSCVWKRAYRLRLTFRGSRRSLPKHGGAFWQHETISLSQHPGRTYLSPLRRGPSVLPRRSVRIRPSVPVATLPWVLDIRRFSAIVSRQRAHLGVGSGRPGDPVARSAQLRALQMRWLFIVPRNSSRPKEPGAPH